MDLEQLRNESTVCGSNISLLSLEEKVLLQNSLQLVKEEKKYKKILFWGKIFGQKATYYILTGKGEDFLLDQEMLYSFDCLKWFDLIPLQRLPEVASMRQTFTGDPSYIYEVLPLENGEVRDENKTISFNEETRLASTVGHIQYEVAIVPRGACYRCIDGTVRENPYFSGLPQEEASLLSSYVHLRPRMKVWGQEFDKNIDFLEPISEDIVVDQWTIHTNRANGMVVIRNYAWPGSVFHHQLGTKCYSQLYVGCGRRNNDTHFMF